MQVIETERLSLRHITTDDAPFMLALLNDPSWIKNIGDRGVRTLEAAATYIADRMVKDYGENGFGLYLVETKAYKASIGICGLIKRNGLDDIDIGFAFLPDFTGQGYAHESAVAVVRHAKVNVRLRRLVAIVDKSNGRSIHLLGKLGFEYEKDIVLPGETEAIALYGQQFQ